MDNFDFDGYIDNLKAAADIVDIISRDEPLIQKGHEWRGQHNHSLQVSPDKGLWRDWGEHNLGGDAIRWLEVMHKLDFKSAVEKLASLVGMESPQWHKEDAQARMATRAKYNIFDVAANFFQRKLETSAPAARYCKYRGWNTETVKAERLGYFDGDYNGLRAEFRMYEFDLECPAIVSLVGYRGDVAKWAKRYDVDLSGKMGWIERGYITGLFRNCLVFPHIEHGRVRYFSARSVGRMWEDNANNCFVVWDAVTDKETRYPYTPDDKVSYDNAKDAARKAGKKHHNLQAELVGEKVPAWNSVANIGHSDVVIVEGQADKVTLAQWDIPAVALTGCDLGDEKDPSKSEIKRLLRYLSDAQKKGFVIFTGLDTDTSGRKGVKALADYLGPVIRVVEWPDHDVNDWAMNDPKNATAEAAQGLVDNALPYILHWSQYIGKLESWEKPPQLDALMTAIATRMTEAEKSLYRGQVAKAAGITVGTYDKLLKVKEDAGEDEDEEGTPIGYTTVGGMVDGHLLEMLYIPPDDQPANAVVLQGGETFFAVRDPQGNINVKPYLDSNGMRFFPIPASTPFLREGVVILAPRVGELCKTQALIRKIQDLIHKYVDIDPFYEVLSAYYVLFTWFYDAFPTLSYLRVIGDAGSGKTRFLEVVGSLCYRPTLMNAGASVSAMFRIMDVIRGTLVLDEGDFAKSDESADIAKLLNVGNQRRQGRISRSGSKENNFETEFYNVYSPKVISTRKTYSDNAIESRCLTKEMGAPTSRNDIPRNLPDTFWTQEVPELQAQLLRYRLEHWSPEINGKPVPIDNCIEPRLQQVTDSLKKMIDDSELLSELQGFIRQYNSQMINERGLQTEAKILEALYVLWETQHDVEEETRDMSLARVAEVANDLIDFENETPTYEWSRYKKKERNRALSSRGVSTYIAKLQLRTTRPSTDRRRRYHVVWDHERIMGLWQRYGLVGEDEKLALMKTHYEIQAIIEEYEEERKAELLNRNYTRYR